MILYSISFNTKTIIKKIWICIFIIDKCTYIDFFNFQLTYIVIFQKDFKVMPASLYVVIYNQRF